MPAKIQVTGAVAWEGGQGAAAWPHGLPCQWSMHSPAMLLAETGVSEAGCYVDHLGQADGVGGVSLLHRADEERKGA